jgi:DnaJ-class molecular chaperone
MDPHEVLGVSTSASSDVIKKQYRKMTLSCHPDRPGGDTVKFQKLTQAYESLLRRSECPMPQPQTPAPMTPSPIKVEISLEQAFSGCSVPFEVDGERFYADLMPGVDDKEVVKVGDRKVVVHVRNDTGMTRQGLDLTYVHRITLKEALCGLQFELDYFHQKIRLSTTNTVITPTFTKVLQGKGMKRGANTGNLILKFDISFPLLTPDQVADLDRIL